MIIVGHCQENKDFVLRNDKMYSVHVQLLNNKELAESVVKL